MHGLNNPHLPRPRLTFKVLMALHYSSCFHANAVIVVAASLMNAQIFHPAIPFRAVTGDPNTLSTLLIVRPAGSQLSSMKYRSDKNEADSHLLLHMLCCKVVVLDSVAPPNQDKILLRPKA